MSEPTFEALKPGFFRRLGAIFYDWMLLIAVILVAVTVFTVAIDMLFGSNASQEVLQDPLVKLLYQLYLLLVAGIFYVWFWTHGGQTLGMKVWKIKIVDNNLGTISFKQAMLRLLYAVISCLPLGLGLFWMLFNPQKQTLYDRWSKTQLVMVETRKVNANDG